MRIRAYDESYLSDAMNNLGDMFDYAVYEGSRNPDSFYIQFIVSGIARKFARGNPKYVAGLSGPELACQVIYLTEGIRINYPPSEYLDKSPEYWAGWALAYYQWYTALGFDYLYNSGLTFHKLISLYPTLHEADLSKFVAVADKLIEKNKMSRASRLQEIRKSRGLTQRELSEASGVSLRMVQLYEQRQQDISKAEAISLVNMAHVLGCREEDLLE